jgi:hypothetical protein
VDQSTRGTQGVRGRGVCGALHARRRASTRGGSAAQGRCVCVCVCVRELLRHLHGDVWGPVWDCIIDLKWRPSQSQSIYRSISIYLFLTWSKPDYPLDYPLRDGGAASECRCFQAAEPTQSRKTSTLSQIEEMVSI